MKADNAVRCEDLGGGRYAFIYFANETITRCGQCVRESKFTCARCGVPLCGGHVKLGTKNLWCGQHYNEMTAKAKKRKGK